METTGLGNIIQWTDLDVEVHQGQWTVELNGER